MRALTSVVVQLQKAGEHAAAPTAAALVPCVPWVGQVLRGSDEDHDLAQLALGVLTRLAFGLQRKRPLCPVLPDVCTALEHHRDSVEVVDEALALARCMATAKEPEVQVRWHVMHRNGVCV
jgi:hypothetical protein